MTSLLKTETANIIERLKKETSGDISKITVEKIQAVPVIASDSKELVSLAENVLEGSLLLGYYHADEKKEKDFADDDFNFSLGSHAVPFEEAVQFLRSKIPMEKNEWNELEQKLRFRAFTVAKLNNADHIEDLKKRLTNAVEKGESMLESWQDIEKMTEGWGEKFSAGYWETVYRTNVQSAYNAGRLMQYKDNEPPAWELLFVNDQRQSDTCSGLSSMVGGKALPRYHQFWATYGFPPYHYNCRTTFRAVYEDELGTLPEAKVSMYEFDKNFKPQKGFGGNPIEKESFWKLTPEMIERVERYGLIKEIEAFAKKCGVENYSIDKLAKKVGVKVKEAEPKENTTGASGARSKIINDLKDKSVMEQEKTTEKYYKDIDRNKKNLIMKVADNSGFSAGDVEAIINHLFYKKHRFEDGSIKKFDPDTKIVIALERIRTNEHTETDILLLKHELEELTLMKRKKFRTYEDAHKEANKKYNWEAVVKDEDI